jgi:hypothetical protein
VVQQFTQVEINWNQVLMADKLVLSREKVLRSKEKLYDAGLLEVSEVINAHNSCLKPKTVYKTICTIIGDSVSAYYKQQESWMTTLLY